MNIIDIKFKDNRTGQNDILVKIKGKEWIKRVDSFYLLVEEEPNSTDQVPSRLKNLLEWWIIKIEEADLTKTVYLPIDFSDNYMGCFQVNAIDKEKLEISYGFTQDVMGYSVFPSTLANFDEQITSFILDSKPCSFIFQKSELIESIQLSIKEL